MLNNMRWVIKNKEFLIPIINKVRDLCYEYIRDKCTADDFRNISKKELGYFTSNLESLLDSIYQSQDDKIE